MCIHTARPTYEVGTRDTDDGQDAEQERVVRPEVLEELEVLHGRREQHVSVGQARVRVERLCAELHTRQHAQHDQSANKKL